MRYDPRKHRLPVCPAEGILLVDKPQGWTSFDVVNCVRSRFNVPKVGHCGTLDPAATGLLVLVLGKFTAVSNRLSADDKEYVGTLTLGVETDSGDLDGEVTARHEVTATEAELRQVMAGFLGDQLQLPPMVSAVKVGGKKLYELARKGIEIDREPRPIRISRLEITRCALPECDFVLDCSKGTYVRVLCQDIGKKLGCGGVCSALRRTRCGSFRIEDAVALDRLKEMEQEEFISFMAQRLVATLKQFAPAR